MSQYGQPVSKGDTHVVEVEKPGDSDDEGIAFIDGLAVFIPDVEPGDRVLVRIEYVGDNFARAGAIC